MQIDKVDCENDAAKRSIIWRFKFFVASVAGIRWEKTLHNKGDEREKKSACMNRFVEFGILFYQLFGKGHRNDKE